MLEPYTEVLQAGDERGNGMIVRFRFPSGLTIHGLPTANDYTGEWDLGPTWNYLVEADQLFLVDAGRWHTGGYLVEAMEQLGFKPRDLDFVLLTHGHEDHDGGLAEVVGRTGAATKGHVTYARLARKYPDLAPAEYKRGFPAKCWHCFMPESFYGPNCLGYHRELQEIPVQEIGDGLCSLAAGIETLHTPGHCPDALTITAGQEVLLPGDNLLPGITPWPTSLRMHRVTAPVLGDRYPEPGTLYGLKRYLKSIKELQARYRANSDLAILPAHRLFHEGRLNSMQMEQRVDEMVQHHVDRCADILSILSAGPQDAEAVARRHFPPARLKGVGITMAKNEVICHCELLMEAGDVEVSAEREYSATGSENFVDLIRGI